MLFLLTLDCESSKPRADILIEEEIKLAETSDGNFEAFVTGAWNIAGNPNGGFLLSIVLAAIRRRTSHPDPLSMTVHYLRPGSPDLPCVVEVDMVREGRTVATLRGRLIQEGRVRIEMLVAMGNVQDSVGVDHQLMPQAPSLPAPEDCVPRSGDLQNVELPINDRVDVRLHPDQIEASPEKPAEISGWIRLHDSSPPTTASLPLFADCFPPSVYPRLGRVGWVPTLELTVHVRRAPAPGWVKAVLKTDDLSGGRMIESGMLWDSTGQLVAQSRQLGLVMAAAD